jgi:hypothetical protein
MSIRVRTRVGHNHEKLKKNFITQRTINDDFKYYNGQSEIYGSVCKKGGRCGERLRSGGCQSLIEWVYFHPNKVSIWFIMNR